MVIIEINLKPRRHCYRTQTDPHSLDALSDVVSIFVHEGAEIIPMHRGEVSFEILFREGKLNFPCCMIALSLTD
jgi:hypothetical protein